MTTKEDKKQFYTLTKDFMISAIQAAERELEIIEQQIPYYLSEVPKNRYVVSLLTDLFSANYRISCEFGFHLKNGMVEKNESGKECVCFAQEQFFIIQSLILARYYITKDISEVSSLSIIEN